MSKYINIANELILKINNNLQKGISKLPTEAELCNQYQVSRQTIRAALGTLEQQGLIERRQGSGAYATGLSVSEELNTIPILISSADEYIYPTLLSEIGEKVNAYGFTLQILTTANNTDEERKHLRKLLTNPPRILVVEGCKSALPNPNIPYYEQLKEKGTSLLFLHNYYREQKNVPYIKDDNFYGGYLLAEHLWNTGHRKIAGIFKIDDLQGLERYRGCCTALRDRNAFLSDENIRWYTSREHDAMRLKKDSRFLTDFIKHQLSDCSAIICHNDEIAYRLIKELEYTGIEVPHQMSVVSFDHSYLSELGHVRITTLAHEPEDMSSSVVSAILQLLKGNSVVSKELPWHLIKKGSDAPCDTLWENSPASS